MRPLAAAAVLALCAAAVLSAPTPAAADPKVSAGFTPDGQAFAGVSGVKPAAGTPPAQAAPPAAGGLLTGAAGILGAAAGAGLVQPLPPLPARQKIKPLDDENENAEDPDVRRGVRTALGVLDDNASEDRLTTIQERLAPFLRSERRPDHRCSDGQGGFTCSCPRDGKPVCGVRCQGTCYVRGGNDVDGIDCSHLVAATDPSFWEGVNELPLVCRDKTETCKSRTRCPLLSPINGCGRGTQQQLQLLKMKGYDDITNPEDLRAGDAAFFQVGKEGPVEHVVQVIGKPECSSVGSSQVCRIRIVSAPSPGSPVHETRLTLTNRCYCALRDKKKVCLENQCLAGGGSPP